MELPKCPEKSLTASVRGFVVPLLVVDLLAGFGGAPQQGPGTGGVRNVCLVLSAWFDTGDVWISEKSVNSQQY